MSVAKTLLSCLTCVALASAMAACSAASDGPEPEAHDQSAALARAASNPKLVEASAALERSGWAVTSLGAARVEWIEAPSGGEWTRVRVPVSRGSGEDALGGELVVAWPERGEDVFAVNPGSEQALEPMMAALPEDREASESRADEETPRAASGESVDFNTEAASCKAIDASCTTSSQCCRGLACGYVSPYYSKCACSGAVTVSYPERATASVACFNLPDNPIGAAKIQRYKRGCTAGGAWNLSANACGDAVSTPGYTTSTWTQLICLRTPGPIC